MRYRPKIFASEKLILSGAPTAAKPRVLQGRDPSDEGQLTLFGVKG